MSPLNLCGSPYGSSELWWRTNSVSTYIFWWLFSIAFPATFLNLMCLILRQVIRFHWKFSQLWTASRSSRKPRQVLRHQLRSGSPLASFPYLYDVINTCSLHCCWWMQSLFFELGTVCAVKSIVTQQIFRDCIHGLLFAFPVHCDVFLSWRKQSHRHLPQEDSFLSKVMRLTQCNVDLPNTECWAHICVGELWIPLVWNWVDVRTQGWWYYSAKIVVW